MKQVYPRIYVGSDRDVPEAMKKGMFICHCAKYPWHYNMVGKRKLFPSDPEYLWAERPNEIAMNLVDYEKFDERFYPITKKMLLEVWRELSDAWDDGREILIHCNQGVSRSPMVAWGFVKLKFNDDIKHGCPRDFIRVCVRKAVEDE